MQIFIYKFVFPFYSCLFTFFAAFHILSNVLLGPKSCGLNSLTCLPFKTSWHSMHQNILTCKPSKKLRHPSCRRISQQKNVPEKEVLQKSIQVGVTEFKFVLHGVISTEWIDYWLYFSLQIVRVMECVCKCCEQFMLTWKSWWIRISCVFLAAEISFLARTSFIKVEQRNETCSIQDFPTQAISGGFLIPR